MRAIKDNAGSLERKSNAGDSHDVRHGIVMMRSHPKFAIETCVLRM
jgi:hypothetical protein